MNILDNVFGLWWVAIWATAAALCTLVGAFRGDAILRPARLMLGVAAIAFSYWWDIATPLSDMAPAEMRRGAGIVLWPSLWWTIHGQVRHRRLQVDQLAKLTGEIGNGR